MLFTVDFVWLKSRISITLVAIFNNPIYFKNNLRRNLS